jgi:predicted nucleic acid-binding protein
MERALRLAVEYGISAYDAQYVTLAETLDCLLMTADKRLCRKFPKRCKGLG